MEHETTVRLRVESDERDEREVEAAVLADYERNKVGETPEGDAVWLVEAKPARCLVVLLESRPHQTAEDSTTVLGSYWNPREAQRALEAERQRHLDSGSDCQVWTVEVPLPGV